MATLLMDATRRGVRSFVRREGRITPAQRQALDVLWPRYGIEGDRPLDLDALFGRQAPRHLEVGFGNGEALLAMAVAHPENDYLGVEVHRPGIGRLLARLEARESTNVRLVGRDAVEVLRDAVPDASLDGVYVFFPDPWPKKRHHKRRLIQPPFVNLLAAKMRMGACVHLATDWEDYALQILAVFEANPAFSNHAGKGLFCERPAGRIQTRFEARGKSLGHRVHDLCFERGVRLA